MIGAILAKKLANNSFEAFNRGDIEKLMASWSEDAIYTFPGKTPISGETKGKEAIEAVHAKMLELFPQIHFTVKEVFVSNIFAMGSTNNIAVEYELTYTNHEGQKCHNSGVTIVRLKGGKVVESKEYVFNI